MKWIQYRKESPGIIAFKYDYDEPFQEIQVTGNYKKPPSIATNRKRSSRAKPPKSMPLNVPLLLSGPVPISDAKYADLQSLCLSLHIPGDYHSFYGNLLHIGATETENIDDVEGTDETE